MRLALASLYPNWEPVIQPCCSPATGFTDSVQTCSELQIDCLFNFRNLRQIILTAMLTVAIAIRNQVVPATSLAIRADLHLPLVQVGILSFFLKA